MNKLIPNICIILLLILSTGTIVGQLFGAEIILISFFLIILLLFIEGVQTINIKLFYGIIFAIFFILFFIIITIKDNQNNDNYYKIILSVVVLSFYNAYILVHKINLLKSIYISLCIILFLSILNLVVVYLFPNNFIYLDKIGISSLLYIFNYHSTQELFSVTIYRNQGIFWEPGILQIFMNILLFLSIFIYKNRFITIASIMIILSTFSTTGFIIMSLILFNIFSYKSKNPLHIVAYICIILIMIYLIYLNIDDKINTKFASISLRAYDLMISIEIIRDNFVTGIGYYPDLFERIQLNYTPILTDFDTSQARGNTNSILMFATYFGLIAFVFYVISLYNQGIVNKNKILFSIIIIISLMSEPLALMNFFLLFYVNGAINSIRKLI